MANKPTQPVFPLGLVAEEQSTLAGILNTGTIEHGPDAVLTLPEGNASAGLPSSVRYNADSDEFEGFYENGGWLPLGGGGIRWEALPHASTATLTEGRGYLVDNSTGVSTVVFPSPTRIGDSVTVCDLYGKFSLYPLTIDPNGRPMYGSVEPMTLSTDSVSATFTWSGDARGWIVTAGVGLGQGRVYSRTIFTETVSVDTAQVTLTTQPSIVDVYVDGKRLLESKYSLNGFNVDFSPSIPSGSELQVIQYVPIQLGNGSGGSGGGTVITWIYNSGSAVGGETEIELDVDAEDVSEIFVEGSRQQKGLGFTYDSDTKIISLADELEAEDEVVVVINGDPTLYNQIDRTPNEVARSANVKDSEVILSSNTTQYLNGKKVVYDVVAQKIYSLPALPANVHINTVSNGQLTYSPGNIIVDLLPVQTPGERLRQDLLDPTKGTHLITHDDTNLHEYLQKERVLLSEYGGDLAVALSNHDTVIIDSDYALASNIIVPSGKTIKTINGAKVNVSNGGAFVTEHVSATQYYADTPDVPQIAITANVASGATSITLADASGIAVGDSLILKNGYCDMWRVLESGDAGVQRRAVDSLTYKSEIVKVLAVAGNVVTTSPINYDYPVTPTTYGYVTNENNLPEYAGYNRPSVTKMQYKDITLDLDVYIPSTVTNTVFHLSYVDGLNVSLRMTSKATIYKPILITMCDNLNLHDTRINGHKGGVVWIQETTRGVVSNFQAIDWKGGHDTPLCFMLMSPIVASGISVSASEKQLNSSAVYANTCDGGTITGVSARNTARVADVSFSRSIVVSDVTGKNCDFAFGAFSASSCKLSGAVVEGYCFQNASTTIYTATLVYCSNTTNVSYSDITRVKDKGYGRIRVNGCVGLKMRDITAPATHYHAVIDAKATEVAQGASNLQVNASDCIFGGFWRESTYYDAADEAGYSYPLSLYDNIKISDGGSISTGGRFNPADKFNFVSNVDCTLDGAIFGGEISGRVRSITVGSTGKNTCFPDISKLKLAVKPVVGVFVSVDTNMSNGSVWSTSFENGSKISDVYSRKLYVNTSVRGTAPVWLQGV